MNLYVYMLLIIDVVQSCKQIIALFSSLFRLRCFVN